jgi:hypothetical protein
VIEVGHGRRLVYFPDASRLLANRKTEICEIIKVYDPDQDPDYDFKIKQAARIWRRCNAFGNTTS